MTSKRPTAREEQALVAYQDAVRRLRLLGAQVENHRSADGNTMNIAVGWGAIEHEFADRGFRQHARHESFPGVEGKGQSQFECFDGAARWLEGIEGEIGLMPLVDVLERIGTNPREDTTTALVLHRAKMRYEGPVWMTLDRAYLHRIYRWPASIHPNRAARRAEAASG